MFAVPVLQALLLQACSVIVFPPADEYDVAKLQPPPDAGDPPPDHE